LEQKKKEYEERIETLEMGVAFLKSNTQVDTMRIQRLEECLALGAEGVLPGRQIESLLRVCNQFAPTLPSG